MDIDKIDLRGFSLDLNNEQKWYAKKTLVEQYKRLCKVYDICLECKIDEEYVQAIGMNWQYKHIYEIWQRSKKIKELMNALVEECGEVKKVYETKFVEKGK